MLTFGWVLLGAYQAFQRDWNGLAGETSAWTRGMTAASFGGFMADAIDAAGLPEQCMLHGLRKAGSRRLAEAGCSAHEIMSITGHKTLAEVERYTKAANQKRLAKAAIDRLEGTKLETGFPKPDAAETATPKKS